MSCVCEMVTVCVSKFFFAFFQSPPSFHHARGSSEKTNTQDFLFLGHEKRRKKKKGFYREESLHFYNIQSHNTHTQNVYRAIRMYDCGKCYIFRVAIFVLLVRFNVRIFVRRCKWRTRFWRENFVFSIISSQL